VRARGLGRMGRLRAGWGGGERGQAVGWGKAGQRPAAGSHGLSLSFFYFLFYSFFQREF
jgi:hypothetical protein